jgi:hypothetical protein
LGFTWFLEEEEEIAKTPTQITNNQSLTSIKRQDYSPRESNERKLPEYSPTQQNLNPAILSSLNPGSIARIMVVFTDGTIQEFKTN